VNFRGPLVCSQAVVPAMEQRGAGRIVNGLSAGAFMAGGIYGVSKYALYGLTANLAAELGPRGINVNAIAPGLVETAMTRSRLTPDIRDQIIAAMPMQRLATVDDVANAVAFLASDVASYVSGDTLLVDGACLTR